MLSDFSVFAHLNKSVHEMSIGISEDGFGHTRLTISSRRIILKRDYPKMGYSDWIVHSKQAHRSWIESTNVSFKTNTGGYIMGRRGYFLARVVLLAIMLPAISGFAEESTTYYFDTGRKLILVLQR